MSIVGATAMVLLRLTSPHQASASGEELTLSMSASQDPLTAPTGVSGRLLGYNQPGLEADHIQEIRDAISALKEEGSWLRPATFCP